MKYVIAPVLLASLLLIATNVRAAEGVATIECSQVENARERLACFDAMYPRDPDRPIQAPAPRTFRPGPAPVAPTAPISRSSTREEVLNDPSPGTDATAGRTNPAEEAPIRGQAKSGQGGLFSKDPKIDFTSTIAAIKAEPKQKMVFRLENNQIWIQSAPRELPFEEGDVVSVKSGNLGGFVLRNERGTSTRVVRIK